MSTIDTTEADAVAHLAQQAIEPRELIPGVVYAVADDAGGVTVIDTDDWAENPRHTHADRTVYDAESLANYVNRHKLDGTELYADPNTARIVGIIDSHPGTAIEAGWQKHRVTLICSKSPAWLSWEKFDRQWFKQLDFAEFIELQATDVRSPEPATLLELAQHFTAKRSVDFESSERIQDGQVRLTYKETLNARAGQKGTVEIPTVLTLALRPYIGSPAYAVTARFRYRLDGPELKLGYVLERPQVILESAFNDVVTHVRDGRDPVLTDGTVTDAGFDGIGSATPIFTGKP